MSPPSIALQKLDDDGRPTDESVTLALPDRTIDVFCGAISERLDAARKGGALDFVLRSDLMRLRSVHPQLARTALGAYIAGAADIREIHTCVPHLARHYPSDNIDVALSEALRHRPDLRIEIGQARQRMNLNDRHYNRPHRHDQIMLDMMKGKFPRR